MTSGTLGQAEGWKQNKALTEILITLAEFLWVLFTCCHCRENLEWVQLSNYWKCALLKVWAHYNRGGLNRVNGVNSD